MSSPRSRASHPVVLSLLAGVVVLAGMLAVGQITGRPVGFFTRDITTLCAEAGISLPPYAGAVGLFNFMVWAAAAAIALLVALLVPSRRLWLIGFALFLAVLTADDSLSLHDVAGPKVGVPERLFYVVYLVLGLALAVDVVRRFLVRRRVIGADVAFVLGGFLLAVSIAVDQGFEGQHLAEDGPKLLGAMLWLVVPVLLLPRETIARVQEISRSENAGSR